MSLSSNQRQLRELDLESYEEKSIRWSREHPVPPGVRLNNRTTVREFDVKTDDNGNIMRMPVLIGKPCFGIPAALLRHGRAQAQYVRRLKGRTHNSRCDRCKVSDACQKVVVERITTLELSDTKFRASFDAWEGADGLEEGGFQLATDKLGYGAWTLVQSPLRFAEFSSSNDESVSSCWKEAEADAATEAKRKSEWSVRDRWKNGKTLEKLCEGLDMGRAEREAILKAAFLATGQSSLHGVRSESIQRHGAIWWGREFARLTGQALNPSRIARIAIENRRFTEQSHSVLRQAARADLARIRKLESDAAYNQGVPIWPKFRHPALK